MAPADLLRPLEGQREQTLTVLDSLTEEDLEAVVPGDGRTVRQLLCHLVNRDHGINFVIARALDGEVVHLSEEDLDRPLRWPEWPARSIRTSIPYMLEHEDSHLDELRAAVSRAEH